MQFAPYHDLAAAFLPLLPDSGDGSHDLAHIGRVWAAAGKITDVEGGDREILAAAVLLHDCVAVEKSSPLRGQASRLAAARAREILIAHGWPEPRIEAVAHAIAAHSFSAGIVPQTLEARILQDADRLDAIGAIGVARCFYTAGRMGSHLYHLTDPRAADRPLDDRQFATDHFRAKLLHLQSGFQTEAGAAMAHQRAVVLAGFLAALEAEIGLPPEASVRAQ